MIRFLVFSILTLYSLCGHSEIPRNTVLSFKNGTATFDYAGLVQSLDIQEGFVYVRKCSDPPVNVTCASEHLSQREPINSPYQLSLREPGIYLISVVDSGRGKYGRFELAQWYQLVVNLPESTSEIRSLAQAHKPIYSFHKDEKHFPVYVNNLFNLPLESYHTSALADYSNDEAYKNSTINEDRDTAAEFMRYNGNAEFTLTLKSEIAENITGSESDFPVYWYFEQTSDNYLYITYVTFFAYDKKYPEYIIGSPTTAGSHAIDRESVTLEFTRLGSGPWIPLSTYYAGHLPSQPTAFLGCVDSKKCLQAGGDDSPLASWNGGKTRVSWSNMARVGKKPIVYVAHGSHAHKPGYGYYYVNSNRVPGVSFLDVREASGNPKVEDAVSPSALIELDLNSSDASPLVFSGSIVDGAFDWYRAHPFIRNPTSAWTEFTNNAFDSCVESERGCEDYIHREEDTDGDGIPDESDDFPFDPIFQNDTDGDGVPDERDAFPNDSTETTDLNNDGFGDNAEPVDGLTRFTGTVLDQNGNPIPRALIQIELIQSEFAQDGVIQTRTNTFGDFLIQSDLSVLPNSFAISISSPLHIPDVFIITKNTLGAGLQFVLQDIVLDDSNPNTIIIEPNPILHHLGDDDFGDAINSQFQRSSEDIEYNRVFTVTDSQLVNQSFTFSLSAKGIQVVGVPTSFSFNDNSVISFPQGDINGNYTEEAFTLSISEHLVAGENTLRIRSGYKADIDDYDDFEFINPIISFNQ